MMSRVTYPKNSCWPFRDPLVCLVSSLGNLMSFLINHQTQPARPLAFLLHRFPVSPICLPFIAATFFRYRAPQPPANLIFSTTLFVHVFFLSVGVAGTRYPSSLTRTAPSTSTDFRHYFEDVSHPNSLQTKLLPVRSSPSPFATFTSSVQTPRHSWPLA
jgi:hypothetical protein